MSWDESDEATWERWEAQRAARQLIRALGGALAMWRDCGHLAVDDPAPVCRFCGFDDHNERDCGEG